MIHRWREHDERKKKLLGMPLGTASARLLRSILFDCVQRLGENTCFRCEKEILSVDEFSIEHKEAWLGHAAPVDAFFNLDNISFSHKACNYGASGKTRRKFATRKEWETAYQPTNSANNRARYSPEKRRARYLKNGY